ncbi:MAG TPA: MFS transporter [Brevundimonas sp.]|jgi:MFS family permease|uniref:spinster family MFS transporter n=1 Tax=Brevundimonas sp. TaxID=1871086 RepID=UPI002DE6A56F|nr:MFS transporter [Brevundimonas sp.]
MSSDAAAVSPPASPQGRQAWAALGVLWFIYVLNFLDRQLLSILAKPIQDTLGISDGQLGLLGGLYFAFFYCFIAIPVGWLADRTNRVAVVSVACGIWSAATIACGLSRNFGQLAAARMTVGFGEAGGVPPSYAIITDSFPPRRRGMALGIYNLGPPVGMALGVAFGAKIAAEFSWRDAFVVIGAVGVVVALATPFLVKEPRRGGLDAATAGSAPTKAPFWGTVAAFFREPTLVLAALGSGVTQIVTYGFGNFTALYLMREKGMTLDDLSVWFALIVFFGMGGGIFASGFLIDRFTRRSKTAYALLPAISLTLALPLYLAFLWAPTWPLALVLLLGPTFLNYFYLSSSVALVQEEVAPNRRVLSGALLLLIMNFIGMAVGPTYVGFASDHFGSLETALYTLAPVYVVAILIFLLLARRLSKDTSRAGGLS